MQRLIDGLFVISRLLCTVHMYTALRMRRIAKRCCSRWLPIAVAASPLCLLLLLLLLVVVVVVLEINQCCPVPAGCSVRSTDGALAHVARATATLRCPRRCRSPGPARRGAAWRGPAGQCLALPRWCRLHDVAWRRQLAHYNCCCCWCQCLPLQQLLRWDEAGGRPAGLAQHDDAVADVDDIDWWRGRRRVYLVLLLLIITTAAASRAVSAASSAGFAVIGQAGR